MSDAFQFKLYIEDPEQFDPEQHDPHEVITEIAVDCDRFAEREYESFIDGVLNFTIAELREFYHKAGDAIMRYDREKAQTALPASATDDRTTGDAPLPF